MVTHLLCTLTTPLTYVLTMVKLDVTRHQWIAKLAKFNFTIHYHSGKSDVDADALSQIPRDQNFKTNTVGAIFKAAVNGPGALMEIYTCHKRAIGSFILESPPAWMNAMEWVWAKKADPAIYQGTIWIKDWKLSTVRLVRRCPRR